MATSSQDPGWWVDDQGRNNLAGVKEDPTNLPILPDATILSFLFTHKGAREDFKTRVPRMLPEEQERLYGLVAANPRALKDYVYDDVELGDQMMTSLNVSVFHDPNRRNHRQ